jgi:hypothetical protein
METSQLDSAKIGGIKASRRIARSIQQNHPEIVEDYRNGTTLDGILRKYDFETKYNSRYVTTLSGVRIALAGQKNYFGDGAIEGLISEPKEIKKLGIEHRRTSGEKCAQQQIGVHALTYEERCKLAKRNIEQGKCLTLEERSEIGKRCLTLEERSEIGKRNFEQGKGIASLTSDELSEAGRKGGQNIVQHRKGIHGLTSDEIVKNSKLGGRASVVQRKGIHGLSFEQRSALTKERLTKQGYAIWKEREKYTDLCVFSEAEFANMLSQSPLYKKKSRINWMLIAQKINEVYHGNTRVRNGKTTHLAVYRFRKRQQKTI